MNSQVVGLRVASVVFGLVCLAQLARLLTRIEILVGGTPFPLWPNAVAALITGVLCLWLWRLSRRGSKP
jgi:hypothetical protein